MKITCIGVAAFVTFGTVPASAEVVASSAGGFASSHSVIVAADRGVVWAKLVSPQEWWTHSWSGNSANLTLDPNAGGCFCETIPAPDGGAPGSAEHARVVMVLPHSKLRMVGALGPLQSEGVAGTLTVTLTEVDAGTRIEWDYVLGGQSRFSLEQIAPVVDNVQAEFLGGLVEALGGPV